MQKHKNRLTIAVPCYNAADFIERCLSSLLSIDMDDLQILVIDNKSTDQTLDIVRSHDDKRLKIIENLINYNACYSYYRAYQNAETTYLALIGADDIWVDQHLSQRLDFMDTHPEITVLSGQTEVFQYNNINKTFRAAYREY
ncbi:MAG: glycosyltransferase family A protein, partial [Pseudomonadota bacterium]